MDIRQFVAGSVAGCVGQCVGHPLDSIKVSMQTAMSATHKAQGGGGGATTATGTISPRALSAYQSAVELYRSPYGFRSFFRGLSLPLLTKAVEQSVGFGIKGAVGEALAPHDNDNNHETTSFRKALVVADDSYRAGISGSVAGACTALLLTPVYLVKVQLQATTTLAAMAKSASTTSSTTASGVSLKGPAEAIKVTVSRLGWRGLYTGAFPTFLGSSIGYGFRFATYDTTVRYVRSECFADDDDDDTASNNRTAKIASIVLGGGLAGMATWLSHFPLDLVANKMMADVVLHSEQQSKNGGAATTTKTGMLQQFRKIYVQQGWRGYFRGIGPCLLRAFPVNAAIFLSYEACMGSL